jgi:hypothetical protein
MSKRPGKITFGEMRSAGVRGLLIYCSDYIAAIPQRSAGTGGPTTFGCPILERNLFAEPVARRQIIFGLAAAPVPF